MKQLQSKMKVYNVIILDKSGSMCSIQQAAVGGVNETLAAIRHAQQQFATTQEHLVTLRLFCGCEQRDVYEAVPIDSVTDLRSNQYSPCCSTPLYDAVGSSLEKVAAVALGEQSTVVVTIITDGMENASHHYTGKQVADMIAHYRSLGWTFAYMGADHDVEAAASSMNINNVQEFEHTEVGMEAGFDMEVHARMRHFSRINEMMETDPYISREEQVVRMRNMNETFYEPEQVEIFVFGSNRRGQHNGGAAMEALAHHGAIFGQAEGLQGQSYAIPTVGVSKNEMAQAVARFCQFALNHPEMLFKVTPIGCGHAGYTPREVAPMFAAVKHAPNVILPKQFRVVGSR